MSRSWIGSLKSARADPQEETESPAMIDRADQQQAPRRPVTGSSTSLTAWSNGGSHSEV